MMVTEERILRSPDGKQFVNITKPAHKFLSYIIDKNIKEDDETIGVYSGDNGCGKSLKALHHVYGVTNKLIPISRICFDPEEFVDAILGAKKGDYIQVDEGAAIVFNRSSMTKEGRLVSELFDQIRAKNLWVNIMMRDINMVDPNVLGKVDYIAHCWKDRKDVHGKSVTHKGNCAIFIDDFGLKQATRLIIHKKAKKSNPFAKTKMPNPSIIERGNPVGDTYAKPYYPIVEGEKVYRNRKESVLHKYKHKLSKTKETPFQQKIDAKREVVYNMHKKGMTFRAISDVTGISRSLCSDYFQDWKRRKSEIRPNSVNNGTGGSADE